MKLFFSYPITLVYYFAYLVVLFTIQPIQWVVFKLFGDRGLKIAFDYVAFLV